jgi:hypothetical protein
MKDRIQRILNASIKNVFLYRIYYRFYRSRRGDPVRLPKSSDAFYFDGYPRSGNTFVINMMRHVIGIDKQTYTSHLHSIAGLKIALRKKLKPIIIIRHPKDAVASYYFTKSSHDHLNIQLLKQLTKQYSSYYRFVYKRKEKIKIILFERAVKNEHAFTREVGEWLKISALDDASIETKIKAYKALMKEKEGEKDVRISALPNKARSKHTEASKTTLEGISEYKTALEIYQKIADSVS